VRAAKRPQCPKFDGLWFVSASTKRAVPQRCQSWRCPSCSGVKRAAAVLLVQRGIERAQRDGRRVRFMTLTDDAAGEMTMADLYRAWQRLALRLKRRGRLGEYCAVVEAQERGALHLHTLMADGERGGGFIEQALLSDLAVASGFGPVCDVRLVGEDAAASAETTRYITKALEVYPEARAVAGYVAKASRNDALAARAGARLRPLRVSRGCYGGGLAAAQQELLDLLRGDHPADEGPWELWHESELHDAKIERVPGWGAIVERSPAEGENDG
jgi:hypothetical protein